MLGNEITKNTGNELRQASDIPQRNLQNVRLAL